MNKIVIATKNKGKIRELKSLFENTSIKIRGLDEFENIKEVEETGQTFAENAKLKAEGYAKQSNSWALADDSGLEIEALNNEPGVYSARYAGEDSSDTENLNKVLSKLDKASKKSRKARFVCVMAVSNEQGKTQFIAEGICSGRIVEKPAGYNGFGYDPIFIPDNFDQTFGQLSEDIKQKISHRAKALEKILQFFNENVVS